jgi:hypothetical protein
MITISGLTTRQKAIMDMMWNMQSMDQVTALIRALPTRDAQDAHSLIIIAQQESLEEDGALDAYMDQARSVIASVSR